MTEAGLSFSLSCFLLPQKRNKKKEKKEGKNTTWMYIAGSRPPVGISEVCRKRARKALLRYLRPPQLREARSTFGVWLELLALVALG